MENDEAMKKKDVTQPAARGTDPETALLGKSAGKERNRERAYQTWRQRRKGINRRAWAPEPENWSSELSSATVRSREDGDPETGGSRHACGRRGVVSCMHEPLMNRIVNHGTSN